MKARNHSFRHICFRAAVFYQRMQISSLKEEERKEKKKRKRRYAMSYN
jgi:hypothetical protein